MFLSDLLSPVWVEICMFSLAMACYVAFMGLPVAISGKRPGPRKNVSSPKAKLAKKESDLEARSPSPSTSGDEAPSKPPAKRPSVDPYLIAKSISTFGKEGNLAKAVSTFNAIQESGGKANTLIYNCLLDACVECGDLAAALGYLNEMKAAGLTDVVSFNTMMKGHLSKGDFDSAFAVFEEMSASGVVPTQSAFHAILNALAQRADRVRVWQVMQRMGDAGFEANAITCSILLKTVTSSSHTQELKRILALVDRCDKPGEEGLFAVIVEACIRSRNMSLLSDRVESFAAVGDMSKLSCATYGMMIKAFGQARDIDSVWGVWRQMVGQGTLPTAITFGCMVEALVMNGRTVEAWELTNQIWGDESQRESVNTVIYSTLLKGFAMIKAHDKVTTLYDEMRERNIPRNVITYNTILNSIARCGLMDRVSELLEEMQQAEPRVIPDLVTYSTIIKGYCQSGMLDKALGLFRQMQQEAGLSPDEVMFNSLLDGCAREQRLQDALGLLDEMRSAKVAPSNYTLSIICKLLGRSRRLEQAFSLVESISKEHGFTPNIHVYTCLIQACFHNRQINRAFTLHDEMVRQGVLPDEKMYTSMTKGCLQAGLSEKAAAVVRCAYQMPCPGGLLVAKGEPQGVESKCLKEVISALRRNSPQAAASLEKDVQNRLAGQGCTRQHAGAWGRAVQRQ
jgi:pentatricopeptide repeat protein